jgi:hypothetical protein
MFILKCATSYLYQIKPGRFCPAQSAAGATRFKSRKLATKARSSFLTQSLHLTEDLVQVVKVRDEVDQGLHLSN